MITATELETLAYTLLSRKYVQRADKRQAELGLSYTEAETHDLAKLMATFAVGAIAQYNADREYPAGWGPTITS